MNKNVNQFEFQLATLEAAKASDSLIRLIWGYGSDRMRIRPSTLDLTTDESGERWWNVVSYARDQRPNPADWIVVAKTLYKYEGCRVTMYDNCGRRLVNSDSQNIFMNAIRHADIIGPGSINETPDGLCTWADLEFALDYSPLQYAGDFRFEEAELSEFLQANKPALVYSGSGDEFKGHHQKQKIGKSLRYVLDCLGLQYTDAHIEKAVNIIKAANTPLEIVTASSSGVSISEVYDLEAADGTGSLVNSCMRGHGDYYYDLDSCPNVDIAYATNMDGQLVGRALIWKTTEGIIVMDRIYGDDKTIVAFKKYAKENNIWHKAEQSYDNKRDWIKSDGSEVTWGLEVEIDFYNGIEDEMVPYMDTFCFYGVDEQRISNSISIANSYDGNVYELRNTDGCASLR